MNQLQQRSQRTNQKRKLESEEISQPSTQLVSTDFLKNGDGKKKFFEICKFVRLQPWKYHNNIEKILNSILNNQYRYTLSDETLSTFIQDLQKFFLKKDHSLYERFQMQISPLCCPPSRPKKEDHYNNNETTQEPRKKQKISQSRKAQQQLDDQWLCVPSQSTQFIPTKHTFPRICSIIMKEFNAAQRYSLFQLNNSYFNCSKTSEDDKSYYNELADLYNDSSYYAGTYFHLEKAMVFFRNGIKLDYRESTHSKITGYFFFQILQETIRSYLSQLKRYHEAKTEYERANHKNQEDGMSLLTLLREKQGEDEERASAEDFPSFYSFLGEDQLRRSPAAGSDQQQQQQEELSTSGQLNVMFLHASLVFLEEVPLMQFVKSPSPTITSPSLPLLSSIKSQPKKDDDNDDEDDSDDNSEEDSEDDEDDDLDLDEGFDDNDSDDEDDDEDSDDIDEDDDDEEDENDDELSLWD